MESVDHSARPLAVMARGRFWSQVFLQKALDDLRTENKLQNLNDPQNMNTEVLEFGPHH